MKVIETKNAPSAIGPYSQAIQVNGFLYTSGQIAINPKSGLIDDESIEGQTKQVLTNLEQILIASGIKINNVIKTTIFLKDMNDFPVVNQIYQNFFQDHKPARSTVEVSKLPKNAKIEIELVATL